MGSYISPIRKNHSLPAFFVFSFVMLAALVPCPARAAEDKGPPINIELRNVDIKDVLRALSQEHGINIIVDDTVAGTVTVSIRDIPLWEAIDSLLRSKGYTYKVINENLLMVVPLSDFAKKQEDVTVSEFKLKYLKTSDKSVDAIKGFLSDKGQLIPVESTNSVIVKDIPSVLEHVGTLISSMDVEPAQIMIEARIVEVSTTYKEQLGINWGANYQSGNVSSDFTVNLPTTDTPSGILGLAVGQITDKLRLNATLSALEDSGVAKIVSSPKIRVLENQEALIKTGEEIIVPIANATTAAGGVGSTVERQQANLELRVTPRSVGNERVALSINTIKDDFDRSQISPIQGVPPKLTREAKTQLIVGDGETVVIGGIYSKREFSSQSGVPFLSKIPVLGWLFKNRSRDEDKVELLIFITPSIIKKTDIKGLSAKEAMEISP